MERYFSRARTSNETIRYRTETGISYIPEDRQSFGLVLDFDLSTNLALKQYYKEPFSSKGILNKEEFEQSGSKLLINMIFEVGKE